MHPWGRGPRSITTPGRGGGGGAGWDGRESNTRQACRGPTSSVSGPWRRLPRAGLGATRTTTDPVRDRRSEASALLYSGAGTERVSTRCFTRRDGSKFDQNRPSRRPEIDRNWPSGHPQVDHNRPPWRPRIHQNGPTRRCKYDGRRGRGSPRHGAAHLRPLSSGQAQNGGTGCAGCGFRSSGPMGRERAGADGQGEGVWVGFESV